jgi:hypothetical protein
MSVKYRIAFMGRLSRRYVAMELEGFRKTAEAAHG